MARETDYTVVYRAAADFSALAREAAKAKAILKSMREEEEKANKVSLKDQDALEKARTRARKALEAQNMAATTSARISREMAERGKREAETVKELARNSEVAARQISKLAEAYKKLNSASSGETSSSANRNITGNTSFAAVTARELEKVQKNLASYMASARSTSDTNTRLDASMKNVKETTSQYADILTRLDAKQREAAKGTTIITQETKKLGDVVETTTRKVHNAGTAAERVETTIRRVTKETEQSGTAFQRWAGNVVGNLRRAWREADNGVSVFGKLKSAMSSGGGNDRGLDRFVKVLYGIRDGATSAVSAIAHLPRAVQVAIGLATIFEPIVAVLGSLGAAALGAGNNLVYLAGSLAAIPGLIAAGATAVAALFVALKPAAGAIQQYSKALQESADNADKSAPKQRSNADAIRSAIRGVRTATESLADAQRAEKRAQEDLSQAWRDAKKDLQDLRDEVSRGSLDEEGAVIRLARAKEEQAKVNGDIKSSDLDRREAALGVKEAEADLADVRKRNKENAAELAESEKKGVANSERVVRAQENLANAHRGVENASLNLADAKAQLASASKVEAAAATVTTTQQDRYNRLLKELGPNTRKFVEYINGMRDAWKRVQRDTSEAFFKNIAGDTKDLNSLLPITSTLLTTASDALGKVAHRGIEMLSSGPWKADFKQLAKDNAVNIGNMGDAGLSVADAFRHITMAAAPFTKWVTSAIKEGAANFAAWAKKAREDHSIQRFLEEAKDRMQQMWQVAKNVGAALASWNTASNDFGKWLLDRVEAMTRRWKDNAKAQEESGSALRKYLQDVRPVLSSLSSLVGAVALGFAQMAADPENMASTIALLTALEKDVLPPLLRFLDELNDSGIALTVAHALGTIFDALANFLEGGGGGAISTFVKSFAWLIDVAAEILNWGPMGMILGWVAIGWGAIAGATVAAKFLGLFKLIDVFKWLIGTGGMISRRFKDIGDAAADAGQKVNTTTTTVVSPTQPGSRPNSPAQGFSVAQGFKTVSNDELAKVKKNVEEYSKAAEGAAGKSGFFARSLEGVKNAAGRARGGMSSFVDFLGGPWGAALAVATIAVAAFLSEQDRIKGKVDEYKSALDAAAGGYDGMTRGAQNLTAETVNTNPKLAEMIRLMKDAGFSADEIRSSFEGAGEGVENASAKIDKSIEDLRHKIGLSNLDVPGIGKEKAGPLDKLFHGDDVDKLEKLEALKKALDENKISAEDAAAAIEILGLKQEKTSEQTQKYTEKTQAANFAQAAAGEKANAYGEILDVLSDSSATTAQRFEALKRATELMYGDTINANEASENFNRKLIELRDTLKQNGDTLDEHSLSGLNNRDSLEAAASAVKDETLQLIASGVPYKDAIKKHNERIDALKGEYKGSKDNKKIAGELIDQYSKIPEGVKTNVELTGFPAVYENLRQLQFSQYALKNGMSPEEAAASWNRSQAAAKGQYPQGSGSGGLKPNKRAGGGPVWGEGTKTSDSIAAWLSDGEWVHKAASVDYYGHGLMSALNNMEIKKEALDTAMLLSRGSAPKEKLDPMFSLGGSVLRLAQGGFAQVPRIDQVNRVDQVNRISQPHATWPIEVGLGGVTAAARKFFNDWKKNYVSSSDGGTVGAGGLRSGILNILGDLREHFGKVGLISGLRPGATTLSGNTSYHASGRAIDIAPIRAWAEYLRSNFGGVLKELITPWRDINMLNGKPHRYSRNIEAQHGVFGQNAHIHAAFANGGLVEDLNSMYSFGGLATPALAGAPTANVSSLSQAARSVVNHNNSGMNFGDITINNPVPERGGDSIRNSLLRTAMLFDGP